jgi:hypothetical protein
MNDVTALKELQRKEYVDLAGVCSKVSLVEPVLPSCFAKNECRSVCFAAATGLVGPKRFLFLASSFPSATPFVAIV